MLSNGPAPTPGMRVLCRDAEWLVTRVDPSNYAHTHFAIHCVVIDEAHNVAGASVPERHLSYRLARLLSRRTDSMLLTTATPHNGQRETFTVKMTCLSKVRFHGRGWATSVGHVGLDG